MVEEPPTDTFEATRLYRTSDPELRQTGSQTTMRHWRCRGRGREFLKQPNKGIRYRGGDLNRWLEEGSS